MIKDKDQELSLRCGECYTRALIVNVNSAFILLFSSGGLGFPAGAAAGTGFRAAL